MSEAKVDRAYAQAILQDLQAARARLDEVRRLIRAERFARARYNNRCDLPAGHKDRIEAFNEWQAATDAIDAALSPGDNAAGS